MITSLVLDHYGLIGFPVHPLSAVRFIGAALIIMGVVLIQR
jgi:transporter family-2 protein